MARMGGSMAADAVHRLAPMLSDEVIEIGFGPGVGLSTLSKAVPGGHVVGVDPSETMHRQATKRNADAIREGRISLVSGTVAALPFPDKSFDAGMAIDNLHFWPDPLAGLAQLQRVLKPAARFVCAFTPPSGGPPPDLIGLFGRAGYQDVEAHHGDSGYILTASVDR